MVVVQVRFEFAALKAEAEPAFVLDRRKRRVESGSAEHAELGAVGAEELVEFRLVRKSCADLEPARTGFEPVVGRDVDAGYVEIQHVALLEIVDEVGGSVERSGLR